jgi:hypothetical protein
MRVHRSLGVAATLAAATLVLAACGGSGSSSSASGAAGSAASAGSTKLPDPPKIAALGSRWGRARAGST